jgi:3-oxoacyl-ACP reductase-like protein
VVGNSLLVLRVKKAGGVLKFAKRLWHSRTTEQRLKVVASVIGYVAGTGAMVRACTPNDD